MFLFSKRKIKEDKENKQVYKSVVRVPLDAKVPPNPEIQDMIATALKQSDETLRRLGYRQ